MSSDTPTVAVAILALRQLTDDEFAPINMDVLRGRDPFRRAGYEKVAHLFEALPSDLIKDAFARSVNERIS